MPIRSPTVEASNRLQELGVAVGRVVSVSEHAGARAPSYLLTVDLGTQGRHECSVPQGTYEPADLEGTQIVCARDGDELIVLAARSHGGGFVLLRPDRDVEDGTIVA
jgi:tRNA-binding EMAP/Myf-like protein